MQTSHDQALGSCMADSGLFVHGRLRLVVCDCTPSLHDCMCKCLQCVHASVSEAEVYVINECTQVSIIQINGWIILQQRRQEALYLPALNVACVVQIVDAKCNCISKQLVTSMPASNCR